MSYKIKSLTIRTNSTKEGIDSIYEIWKDIESEKIPMMLCDNFNMISKYHNYDNDGYYDMTIISLDYKLFESDIESKSNFKKYEAEGENIAEAINNAWNKVHEDADKGLLKRSFIEDYECSFYSNQINKDKDYCRLYISVL